jgi:uncharacterized radical SAM protein YgiQ
LHFLPTTRVEAGGQLDVVLVTGDAYVDDPSFGAAVIGRWLEAHGFSVGIIAQPPWDGPGAFRALGTPRLFFGVTAGNLDSVVNGITSAGKRRNDDAYSPGGRAGLRPLRASIAYTARIRQACPGVPVVLGGVEASLRRLAHYDYQQRKVRGSILLDSKADLLVYGMGERAVLAVAQRLAEGGDPRACRDIPGVAFPIGAKEPLPHQEPVELPSLEHIQREPQALARATQLAHLHAEPLSARPLLQRHGGRAVWCNPPALALDEAALDRVHELPFARAPHPRYTDGVPAFEAVRASLTVTRGCGGGCAFCAIALHQGKQVASRSEASVIREAQALASRKGFRGTITDVGGPTANLYGLACASSAARERCRRPSCLHPRRCRHFLGDAYAYARLLDELNRIRGVQNVFVGSGLRHELLLEDHGFVRRLAARHVSGRLTVAPEHTEASVLKLMRKPSIAAFERFAEMFAQANDAAGKRQELMPYLLAGHPGSGPTEAIAMALWLKEHGIRPRQVQLFLPTPGTMATAMFHSGVDPESGEPIPVARGEAERARHRALLLYWKREEAPAVREALQAWGREDLIGRGRGKLVDRGPARGGWERRPRERSTERGPDRAPRCRPKRTR